MAHHDDIMINIDKPWDFYGFLLVHRGGTFDSPVFQFQVPCSTVIFQPVPTCRRPWISRGGSSWWRIVDAKLQENPSKYFPVPWPEWPRKRLSPIVSPIEKTPCGQLQVRQFSPTSQVLHWYHVCGCLLYFQHQSHSVHQRCIWAPWHAAQTTKHEPARRCGKVPHFSQSSNIESPTYMYLPCLCTCG